MILALDIAKKVGWSAGPRGEVPRYGSVVLQGDGSAGGATLAALVDWLTDAIAIHKPDVIAYEAPLPHHSSAQAAKLALRLSGMVELVCYRRSIRCRDHNVRTIRAQVIGNGNCSKDDVVAWVMRMGWPVPLSVGQTDYDSCDAIAVWAHESGIRAQGRML